MNRRVLIVAIVLIAIVGAGLIWGITRNVQSSEAGMGIPTENLVDRPADASGPVDGVVHVANNGCFHLEAEDGTRYMVVWPEGYRQDSAEVVAPDGTRLGAKDRVSGEGWIRSADEVVRAADGPDGYMDMVMGYCADGLHVAVLRGIDVS